MSHTYRVPGAILTEREHIVPLDHARPDGPTITVFTREVADPDGLDRPYLVFLQGGPGFEATRPVSPPYGWMKRAVADYRVLLLDQRGTGRSTPVGSDDPGRHAPGPGHLPDPLSGRLDRPRRRADPPGARGRTLERARPELRWVHVDDLPVDRPGGPPRGVADRRAVADRPAGRRHLRRNVPPADRQEPPLLRAVPRRSSARPRPHAPAGRRGRAATVGRPAYQPALPATRAVARWRYRVRAAASRRRTAVRVTRVPARRRGRRPVPARSDLRHPPRVVVRGRGGHALVRASPLARRGRG